MNGVTRTKRHMSMNLQGVLRNMKGKKIRFFSDDEGNEISDKEARAYIDECLEKGWKVIPMGGEGVCEGFDYQKGCLGHPIN